MKMLILISSRHPELRNIFLHELKAKIQNSQVAMSTLQGKFKAYAAGELLHARDAIIMLYDLLSRNEHLGLAKLSTPDSEPPSMLSQLPGREEPTDWDDLQDAIVVSLRTGIFIDCKCYALVISNQPSDPPNLQALHFCSSVNPGLVQKLSSGSVLIV